MKAIRSVLYVPGNKPSLIEKAPSYGADAIGLVLEDSVPDDQKREAREIVGEAVGRLSAQSQTVLVKINDLDASEAEQDISAVVRPGLAGIIVPKTQSPEAVRRLDALLTAAEAANGLARGSVEVMVLMETPVAVVRGFEIATASPRLATLIFGSAEGGDLARGLGCTWTLAGTERLYVKSKVLLDARAAGFDNPLDGVYTNLNDLEGLVQEAAFAAQLGYRGKLALHPRQVQPINRVFTPSAKEVEHQRRVLEAFESALAAGTAAAVLDGKFIDYAMAATARKVVALADALGVRPD